MNVAEIIRSQLGGNKFIVMTGAKNFSTSGNNLSFSIPGRKINIAQIVLNERDLYDVEFIKSNKRTYDMETVSKASDIDAENLTRVFADHTGIEVSL